MGNIDSRIETFTTKRIPKVVRYWLLVGVVMVFFQVVIGGVTRLTDSGLSITEWSVIQGTLPPLNAAEWNEAFELYKVAAKKQFETLHADMTMSEFKVIFFWEYFHRLWARTMGFVFLFPFLFFVGKRFAGKGENNHWMPGWMAGRLGIVILLAICAATFGWIMVASGLNDNTRTWVSAYKLVIHLSIATVLFGYLFWTWLRAQQPTTVDAHLGRFRKISWGILVVLGIQIIFGGLMAGMRAGLLHPHFPLFVEGDRLLSAITTEVDLSDFVNYEPSGYVKGLVHIVHRVTAYILSAMIVWFFFKLRKENISNKLKTANTLLISMLGIQFLLGILTIINCFGGVPIAYGAMHQAGALILLVVLLFVNYQLINRDTNKV
ncbi:MAG: cytochrome c oxidase assembly protein subunit 15 [Saprospiraceae bacterium]|jgi:cytochrome c oxidase assembly protein subunit 15